MATNLKRIEKEFILGSSRDDKVRFLLIAGSGEWPCLLEEIIVDELSFSHAIPLHLLKRGQAHEFRFMYREQPMAFRSRIIEAKDDLVSTEMPAAVYKDLSRRYSRRPPPTELAISLSFKGDRYELSLPTTREFEAVAEPESDASFDPGDIRGLIGEFNERASAFTTERAVRMFKDKKPGTLEERLIVRTGKALYLPDSAGGLPAVDPYASPRIVTRDSFAEFLSREGVGEGLVAGEIQRFEQGKKSSGIKSEIMIPLLFQEYVIGYVYLVNTQTDRPPFDLGILDTYYQFAKIFAYSLKVNGYFRNAPKKAQSIAAEVIDISAGGLLFASASRELTASLMPGLDIEVSIKARGRAVKAIASLKRVFRDAKRSYFGIEYSEMAPENFRFLFECLYGRGFTDDDASGIEGLGPKMKR